MSKQQSTCVWKPRIRSIIFISIIVLLSNAAIPFLRNKAFSSSAYAQTRSDWTIRQLTINGGSRPAISGDGSKVAFTSSSYAKEVVSVINSDGTGFKQLTTLESRFPSINGNGSKIVFSAIYNETSFGLCLINSDGSEFRELVHLGNTAYSSISYDGSKIAFIAFHNEPELYVINSDGTGLRQLASGMILISPGENARSLITADGSKIVFYAFVDSNADNKSDSLDIYTVNSDGTELNRLTTGRTATYPSISNDGTRIAFTESESTYIINSDGTGLTQLTSTGEWASISGDGNTVVVEGGVNGNDTIFAVSVNGSSKPLVSTGSNHYPSINYDGSRIVFLSSFGDLYGDNYQIAIALSPESTYSPRTWTVASDGSGDFVRIQGAVNAATVGDVIDVRNGVYPELVTVTKDQLTIQGQSSTLTVVGGFQLLCNYSIITDFRIVGLHHLNPYNQSDIGIEFIGASYNSVEKNILIGCGNAVAFRYIEHDVPYILPESCTYNKIADNDLIGNVCAVNFNVGFTNNSFYHNSFLNNSKDLDYAQGFHEIWDDGYPFGGNYWDKYIGVDLKNGPGQDQLGSDGIIDIPYVISSYGENQIDHYPLLNPWGSTIHVPDDYTTIQKAVDHAIGDMTIIVEGGVYIENIHISKEHLTLRSENEASATIIQAASPSLDAITITASYVNVSGFTVKGASNSAISSILLDNVKACSILYNNLTGNHYAISLNNSHNNTVSNNIVSSNEEGIVCKASSNNIFKDNTIKQNSIGIKLESATDNSIFHNMFTNNTQQVITFNSSNQWDNGYPSGGNNWSDYTGIDTDYDGIGETPYIIDSNNTDRHPFTSRHELIQSTPSLILNLGSSASFFITDPLGRSFGVDPKTGQNLTQIPDASCSGSSPRIIVIKNPSNGTYSIQICATTTCSYTLSIELSTSSGSSVKNYTGQISTGETQLHIADVVGSTLLLRQLESFPWMLYAGLSALVVSAGIVLLMIHGQRSQRFFKISDDESETIVY